MPNIGIRLFARKQWYDSQTTTSPSSKSMVIQRSQVRIVAMNQTGSWGVDLQRMQSAVVVTLLQTTQIYV
uniref:Uncharacterized protein n=1 Tax=mine drainage metagenome TaxID=410659 RepID=E6QJ36_9ZZZZ